MQEEVQGILEAEVHFLSSIYSVAAMDGQTANHLHRSICEYANDEILTVMCMGHNIGWEEAASMFSGVSVELKTCNAALLEATGKSWEEAFSLTRFGGWKLHGIVKPDAGLEKGANIHVSFYVTLSPVSLLCDTQPRRKQREEGQRRKIHCQHFALLSKFSVSVFSKTVRLTCYIQVNEVDCSL